MNGWKSHKVWNKLYPDDLIKPGDGYVIHHKDENHYNDTPCNLQKMTSKEHKKLHRKGKPSNMLGKKHSEISKKKTSAALKGRKKTPETVLKMKAAQSRNPSRGMLGKHHSEETKWKIANSQKGKFIPKEQRLKMSLAAMGRIPWNKGKTGLVFQSENTKAKMRLAQQNRRVKEKQGGTRRCLNSSVM